MRVIVFFDLPVDSAAARRAYTKFRKGLIKEGFIMMQYSVYSKLALNNTVAEAIMNTVRKTTPSHGTVELLVITENQYARIEYIIGEKRTEIIDTDERVVIL